MNLKSIWKSHRDSLLVFTIIGGVVLLTLIILINIYFIPKKLPETKNPYPMRFTSPQNVIREPSIFHLNETVKVEATFNNVTKQDVTFSAVVYWKLSSSPTPKNYVSPFEDFHQTLRPGCEDLTFPNNALIGVRRITNKLFEDGHKKVTWKIQGYNNVVIPRNSGSKRFEVEEFSYIPDNVELPEYKPVYDDNSCGGSEANTP